jgi:hypothetical protein
MKTNKTPIHTPTWLTTALQCEANYNFEQFSEKLEPMRHILGTAVEKKCDHPIWISWATPVEPGPTSNQFPTASNPWKYMETHRNILQ